MSQSSFKGSPQNGGVPFGFPPTPPRKGHPQNIQAHIGRTRSPWVVGIGRVHLVVSWPMVS